MPLDHDLPGLNAFAKQRPGFPADTRPPTTTPAAVQIFSLYDNIAAGSSTEAFKNAMLAACLMGFLIVVAFCAMCLVTLIL